jgi:hypothetical protein
VLRKYRESRARVQLIMGPLGSGKTFESCQKLFRAMCEQRPNKAGRRKTRFYAVRNTYPDLLSTTVKDWMDLFGELGHYKGGGMEPPTHHLLFKLRDKTIVQSELVFLALDRPQSIKRLRGAQATGFWLNEAKELDKGIVDMADLRHGRYPSAMDGGPSWHGMIGDTNAPDDDNWYYEMEIEAKPEGWVFFRQPGGVYKEMVETSKGRFEWTGKWLINDQAENLNNLPPGYYKNGLEGKSTEWISVNLANEYGSVHDGMPVYRDQWNDMIHVDEDVKFIPDWPVEVGLDFGLTPSAVITQMSPRGTLLILDELVSEGMGINQFVKTILKPHLKAHYKAAKEFNYIGDPAGNKGVETDKQTVFRELQDLGIEAYEANTNDPLIRWEAVRWFLEQLRDGKPAFLLHPRAKILRKGFNGGYRLRRIQVPGDKRFHTKADKNRFSHPHDGLQYVCMFYRGDYQIPSSVFEREDNEDYTVEDDSWGD